jgi:hypothetical protein
MGGSVLQNNQMMCGFCTIVYAKTNARSYPAIRASSLCDFTLTFARTFPKRLQSFKTKKWEHRLCSHHS